MKETLCSPCVDDGWQVCRFKRVIGEFIEGIPPIEQQTKQRAGELTISKEAAKAAEIVQIARQVADNRGCIYRDSDPQYPGKNTL